jgi:hypothetical protein
MPLHLGPPECPREQVPQVREYRHRNRREDDCNAPDTP